MTIHIRSAHKGDLPEILAIYNDAVLNTTASYDYEPHTLEQRTAWFDQHQQQKLPIIVAVDDAGTVLGWGSLSHFRERIGYRFTVEHSVYVSPDHRRRGIGRMIVSELIDMARALGKRVIVGGVDTLNEGSIQLHKQLGFEEVAHFKQVGFKFGRWLDVVFMERFLVDPTSALAPTEPEPVQLRSQA